MTAFIQHLIEQNRYQSTHLLAILRAVQAQYFYIPHEAIEHIAQQLDIPRTQIIGVIEFYSFLHLSPRGQYDLLISDSITDHLLGKHEITAYLEQQLHVKLGEVRADGVVSLANTSCTGLCDQGPAGLVNGYALPHLDKAKVDQITALINLQIPLDAWPQDLFYVEDNLIKAGLLLSAPIALGEALQAAFNRGLPETLSELDSSGLRGRGGAGFKTATKWKFCAEEANADRIVVCNADEGEPGTFKDRVLLNTYAHQVFEGMTLCAALIGAKQGFLYLRGEYCHLHEKLIAILAERRQAGLLGTQILGADFTFDIEICLGAGA